MLVKNLALTLALCSLLGCSGVSQKSFVPVTSSGSYLLKEDVLYVALKGNAFRPEVINGLAKGSYVASFEDSSHVYYEGHGACILPFKDRGGIAIPKDGSMPRLWVYIRDDSEELRNTGSGLVPSLLSGVEAGRVRIFNTTVSSELLSQLQRQ
jgi:hypothetical protein